VAIPVTIYIVVLALLSTPTGGEPAALAYHLTVAHWATRQPGRQPAPSTAAHPHRPHPRSSAPRPFSSGHPQLSKVVLDGVRFALERHVGGVLDGVEGSGGVGLPTAPLVACASRPATGPSGATRRRRPVAATIRATVRRGDRDDRRDGRGDHEKVTGRSDRAGDRRRGLLDREREHDRGHKRAG